ncbi:transcription factor bHLH96-like protein [Trifolium pratense]|uniref:Transcription factor bHLH96-like protein n=1 Tax=Trifolium pratense TaxID=57577 RepID=A0A2K3LGR4_TRIPR|nr:transcription factor bHLH96-like protein [Trifolium pratense]
MALEPTLLYQHQQQDPFTYGFNKDLYNYNLLTDFEANSFDYSTSNFNLQNDQQQQGSVSTFINNQTESYPFQTNNCSSSEQPPLLLPQMDEVETLHVTNPCLEDSSISTRCRPKKRRVKTSKNKEEIENQRMTHIAVERNRRKQMNQYLSVLRSLMPESYVQRGDQASIIGGAINFVKKLEQRLQFLANNGEIEKMGEVQTSNIADVEVTMVESHANLKIRSKKRPKQLLKMVSSLHGMCLTILHLNVTTTDEFVFYSLSVKVEDNCKLGSVDEIAAAVYQMLERIHQESLSILN